MPDTEEIRKDLRFASSTFRNTAPMYDALENAQGLLASLESGGTIELASEAMAAYASAQGYHQKSAALLHKVMPKIERWASSEDNVAKQSMAASIARDVYDLQSNMESARLVLQEEYIPRVSEMASRLEGSDVAAKLNKSAKEPAMTIGGYYSDAIPAIRRLGQTFPPPQMELE